MKQFTDKLPSGLILIIKAIMKVIYAFMKILVKQKNNRVLFMSRQANELSIDFRLLKNNIEQNHSEVEIRYICKRFDDSGKNKITFAVSMIKSMYYLATAKVCVIDAYIPTISILKHKKSLVVIQMWHSIGKIKQSGYQTLGKEGGRDKIKAQLLDMHKNYDYVIAGGSAWNEFYCKSFNIAEDKIINIGLPRIDYLLSTKESNKKKFYKYYPEFTEKIIVLRGKKSNLSEMLWNLVALVLSIVLTIFVVIFLGNEVICFPLILSCLAYILSCILWWYQNRDNDSFKNIGENALGGSPEQFN